MRLIKAVFFLIVLSLLCSIGYGQSFIWQGSTNQFVGQLGGLGSNKWFLLPNDTLKFTSPLREDGLLAYKSGTVYVYDSAGCGCYKALANASGSVYTAGYGLVLVANQFRVDTTQIATQFDLTQLGSNYIQNQTSAIQNAEFRIKGGEADSFILNTPVNYSALTPNKFVFKNMNHRDTGVNDTVYGRMGIVYEDHTGLQHDFWAFGSGGSLVGFGQSQSALAHSTAIYLGEYTTGSVSPFGAVFWADNRKGRLGWNNNRGYNTNAANNKTVAYWDSLYVFTTIGLDNYDYNINGSLTTLSKITKGYGDSAYVSLFGSYSNPSWITSLAWGKITGTPTTLAGYGITDAASSSIPLQTVLTNGNVSNVSARIGLITSPITNPTITESSTTQFLGRQATNNIYWFASPATAGGTVLNVTKARDTSINTAILAGDDFFSILMRGTDGTSASALLGPNMVFQASNNWTGSSRGCEWIYSQPATGSTTSVRRFRITDNISYIDETGVGSGIIGGTTNALNSRLKVHGTATADSIRSTLFTGQIPKTTADGVLVPTTSGTDYIAGGTGTANTIAKFTASGVINNSTITDDGTTVTINSGTTVNTTAITSLQYKGTVIVSSAGTLGLDAIHTDFVFSGTTTTWTLPAVSGTTGVLFRIKNRGSGAITLNAAGGASEIYNTSAVNTLTINAGEAFEFVSDGTYYLVE